MPKIGRDAKWQLNLIDPDGTRAEVMELRAIGKPQTFPIENSRPMAVTNPIFVMVGTQPIRSKASADYFVKWIDKLTAMASADKGWRSDTEKAHVLGQFREARDIYLARGKEAASAGRP